MPSRYSHGLKAFFRPSSLKDWKPTPLRVDVEVDLDRVSGVVCKVQNQKGNHERSIQLTVTPKQSKSKKTIVIYEDESDGESGRDVVVSRKSSDSRRRHGKTKSVRFSDDGGDDSGGGSDSSDGDSDGDETVHEKKSKGKKVAKKIRKSKKESKTNVSRQDEPEQNTTETPAQSVARGSMVVQQPVYIPVYIPVPAHHGVPTPVTYMAPQMQAINTAATMAAPPGPMTAPLFAPPALLTPASETPSSSTRRPLSASFGFLRRIGRPASWRSSTQTDDRRAERERYSRQSSPRRRRSRHYHHVRRTDEPEREREHSHEHEIEHQCHSCGNPRSQYYQDERPIPPGSKPPLSLCSSCRHRLGSSYTMVLGPNREDLSERYWCRICGFLRSPDYHERHGRPSRAFPSRNVCRRCRSERRQDPGLEGRRREDDERAGGLDGHDDNNHHEQARARNRQPDNYASSHRTWSTAGAWVPRLREPTANGHLPQQPSRFVRDNTPTYQPPTVRMATASETNSLRSGRRSRADRASVRGATASDDDERGLSRETLATTETLRFVDRNASPELAGTPRGANISVVAPSTAAAESIRLEQHPRVQTLSSSSMLGARQSERDHSSHAGTGPSDTGASSGGGFLNDPAAAWATVEIDDTLRENFKMDPQERAARRARLMAMTDDGSDIFAQGQNTTDHDDGLYSHSTPRAGPSRRVPETRVWELASDEGLSTYEPRNWRI